MLRITHVFFEESSSTMLFYLTEGTNRGLLQVMEEEAYRLIDSNPSYRQDSETEKVWVLDEIQFPGINIIELESITHNQKNGTWVVHWGSSRSRSTFNISKYDADNLLLHSESENEVTNETEIWTFK